MCLNVTEQVHQPPLSAQTHKIKFPGLSIQAAGVPKSLSELPKKQPIHLRFPSDFSAVLSIATDMPVLSTASHLVNSVNITKASCSGLCFLTFQKAPRLPASSQVCHFLTFLQFPRLTYLLTAQVPKKNATLVRN